MANRRTGLTGIDEMSVNFTLAVFAPHDVHLPDTMAVVRQACWLLSELEWSDASCDRIKRQLRAAWR